MKYDVCVKGPRDIRYHVAAWFYKLSDAERYMTEFLSDRPGYVAEIRLH